MKIKDDNFPSFGWGENVKKNEVCGESLPGILSIHARP